MPSAKAIIRISALPDSALRKALAGTVDAAAKASKQVAATDVKAAKAAEREKLRAAKAAEKAAKDAAQSAIKSAQDHQRAVARSAKEQARQSQALAKQQARDAEKLAKEQVKWEEWAERLKYKAAISTARMAERAAMAQRREAQRSSRLQIREAAKESKAQQSGRRRIAAAAGGAVAGVGAAALGRVRSFQGAFGVQAPEQMMAQAVEMKRRMIVLSDMGGLDAEQNAAIQSKILATSARTGVSANDLLAGLEKAQDKFSDLKGFAAILDQVADVSIAANSSVESVVAAMGVMRRQFGLSGEEMQQLGGAMVTAADLGSVSFDDIATSFGNALGNMGRNANLKGLPGAIKALAISQTLGESDLSAPEASTLGVRVVSALNDVKVQEKLKRAFGVNATKSGKLGDELQDLPTLFQQLADKGFMSPSKGALRQAVFTEERGQRGIEVLVKQFAQDPEKVKALLGLDPGKGTATVQRRVSQLGEGVLGQAATMEARQFQTFMQGDSMQRYLDIAVKSADSLTQLEAKYPLMKEAVEGVTGALKGFAAALIAERMLGGFGGAGAAAKIGTAAAGAGLGTMVAGGVAAGAAGFFGTQALLKLTGGDKAIENAGGALFGALHYEPKRSSARGVAISPQLGAAASVSQSGEPALMSASAPEATLKIKIEGPGRVTSMSSDGFGTIEAMSMDTGRRDILPP